MVMNFKAGLPMLGYNDSQPHKSYEGDINAWLKVRTISRIRSTWMHSYTTEIICSLILALVFIILMIIYRPSMLITDDIF